MVTVATLAEAEGATGAARWQAGDRSQLAAVTVSHAVQHVYPAALAIAYPFVVAAFHVSYGTLGVVLAASGILGGLLQGAAGLFERASARLLLGAQNVGLAVATVLGAVAPTFALFGIARVLGSLASWPQHPVGSAVLTRRFPRRRAFVLSWHVAGGSIGTAVVPIVASALVASVGWRSGLGLFAIPLGVGALAVGTLLRDPGRDRSTGPGSGPRGSAARGAATDGEVAAGPERAAGAERAGASPQEGAGPAGVAGGSVRAAQGVPLRAVLTRRPVVAALAAGTIAAGGRGLGALTTYVPAYLRSHLHLPAVDVGVVFTVVVVGSIAGPVAAGHVADRIGRRLVLVVVYVLAAGAIAGFALVGSGIAALAAVGFAVGVLAYAESPLIQAIFSEAAHGSAERAAFGLYFAIAYGVGSLWMAVLGFVIDRFGFQAAFGVMAASFVVAGLVVAIGGRSVGGARARPSANGTLTGR